MDLRPERWPAPNGPGLTLPPRPSPASEAPPVLLLIDRSDPQARALLTPLRDLLDAGEARRLQQLRQEGDRERFLLGRGVLRLLLGGWLGADPAALALGVGPRGKPGLMGREAAGGAAAPPPLRFNVSHSGDLILLGFHSRREVGVDVEQLRPVPEWEGIARRCLPMARRLAIGALPAGRRDGAFLEEWCRLEAGLKAQGLGVFGLAGEGGTTPPEAELWPVALPVGYVGAAALV
jgi:4'-phosphopantetheinyl transferase